MTRPGPCQRMRSAPTNALAQARQGLPQPPASLPISGAVVLDRPVPFARRVIVSPRGDRGTGGPRSRRPGYRSPQDTHALRDGPVLAMPCQAVRPPHLTVQDDGSAALKARGFALVRLHGDSHGLCCWERFPSYSLCGCTPGSALDTGGNACRGLVHGMVCATLKPARAVV